MDTSLSARRRTRFVTLALASSLLLWPFAFRPDSAAAEPTSDASIQVEALPGEQPSEQQVHTRIITAPHAVIEPASQACADALRAMDATATQSACFDPVLSEGMPAAEAAPTPVHSIQGSSSEPTCTMVFSSAAQGTAEECLMAVLEGAEAVTADPTDPPPLMIPPNCTHYFIMVANQIFS